RQVRVRLPENFAERLLALPAGRRGIALQLALDSRIGDPWDLRKRLASSAELRRVGTLLNQCCRHLGMDGQDRGELAQAVRAHSRGNSHAAEAVTPMKAILRIPVRKKAAAR